jgi:hypothetical protein
VAGPNQERKTGDAEYNRQADTLPGRVGLRGPSLLASVSHCGDEPACETTK